MKTIKIEKNELDISIPTEVLNESSSSSSKQISWGDNTTIELSEPNQTQTNDSIFSKLKLTNNTAPQQTTPSQGMDIQTLYDYITRRFDILEQLCRNTNNN
jgi:hypothetical protein